MTDNKWQKLTDSEVAAAQTNHRERIGRVIAAVSEIMGPETKWSMAFLGRAADGSDAIFSCGNVPPVGQQALFRHVLTSYDDGLVTGAVTQGFSKTGAVVTPPVYDPITGKMKN